MTRLEVDLEKLTMLYTDVKAFADRFDAWIVKQDSIVQTTSALAFGEEYERLHQWLNGNMGGKS